MMPNDASDQTVFVVQQTERIERLSGYIGLLEARYTPEEIDALRADVALREDDIADVFDAGYA